MKRRSLVSGIVGVMSAVAIGANSRGFQSGLKQPTAMRIFSICLQILGMAGATSTHLISEINWGSFVLRRQDFMSIRAMTLGTVERHTTTAVVHVCRPGVDALNQIESLLLVTNSAPITEDASGD
jgi:hypothetical protein